jgi:hypothetical protein
VKRNARILNATKNAGIRCEILFGLTENVCSDLFGEGADEYAFSFSGLYVSITTY